VKKNIIYLNKGKLVGIDMLLPILMELKSLMPDINILMIFSNDNQLRIVKSNYNLWECITLIDARVYPIKGKNKITTLFRLLRFFLIFFREFALRKVIIIKESDMLPCHKITMGIMKAFSKIEEIKVYLNLISSIACKSVQLNHKLSRERRGKSVELGFFDENFDYFLSTLSSEQYRKFFGVETPEIIKVGYVHRLPRWWKYVETTTKKNKILDGGPYFLYILTCLGRRRPEFEEPEIIELLEESLNVLKSYNSRIKTVFKPHAITEIKRLRELLDKIMYTNYVIDYGHPMILSANANFVFGNLYSFAMYDSYYIGKPVVEYSQYDREMLSRLNNRSFGGRCCDFFIDRNKTQLKDVLDKLINGKIFIKRDPDFIKEHFQETPGEFYHFWKKILS